VLLAYIAQSGIRFFGEQVLFRHVPLDSRREQFSLLPPLGRRHCVISYPGQAPWRDGPQRFAFLHGAWFSGIAWLFWPLTFPIANFLAPPP